MAFTITRAATYARFNLLILQVRVLLKETTGVSDDVLSRLSTGLDSPHYIESVAVRGLDSRNKIAAELRINIDWRVYSVEVSAGAIDVEVPSSWRSYESPALQQSAHMFNEIVNQHQLRTEWVATYCDWVNRDEVDELLGFRPAPHREWSHTPEEAEFDFGPLREARLLMRLAI